MIKINLFDQFEKYQLYRRLIVAYFCVLVFYATAETIKYAFAALEVNQASLTTAAVITAVQAPIMAVKYFVCKLYWSGRANNG